jgi:hypothetical protein
MYALHVASIRMKRVCSECVACARFVQVVSIHAFTTHLRLRCMALYVFVCVECGLLVSRSRRTFSFLADTHISYSSLRLHVSHFERPVLLSRW